MVLLLMQSHLFAQKNITVAVAANMQYAVQSLIQAYNKTDPTPVKVVIGASGNLTQQILQGAPFDVFISADSKFPQKLLEEHKTVEKPKVYARGILVMWTAKPGWAPPVKIKDLLQSKYNKIAIANPTSAPYGSAAEYVLKKAGIYDQIKSKLVVGESITQTSQFIATQNVPLGFTAKSIVISDAMKGKGKWRPIASKEYPAIEQAAALIRQNTAAAKFYRFLFSAQAKHIYKQFGYLVP